MVKYLTRLSLILLTINLVTATKAEEDVVDGFLAYCTSNHDWTGICTNTETQISYECIIEAGSIINCKSKRNTPFQCIWVSETRANAAEFWCNKEVDQMLRDEFVNSQSENSIKTTITENALPRTINSAEFAPQETEKETTSKEEIQADPNGQLSGGDADVFLEKSDSEDGINVVNDSAELEQVNEIELLN